MSDPYVVLNIARTASQREVRRAYRRLALERHPDRNPDRRVEAEADLKELNQAYHVLEDVDRRRAYDRGERLPRHPANGARTEPRPSNGRGGDLRVRTVITKEEARVGFIREIVVNAPTRCPTCHGEGFDPKRRSSIRPKACDACRGRGCRRCFGRGFLLPACSSCRGTGAIEAARRVTITVPPRTSHVRVRGEGMPSVSPHHPAGDLLVELRVS